MPAVALEQNTASVAVFTGTFFLTYLAYRQFTASNGKTNGNGKKYPPSIGTVPILGSIPYLARFEEMHTFFLEKSYTLGDIISFEVKGMFTVVLNSQKVIQEAFVRRAGDFATRPPFFYGTYLNPRNKGILDHGYDAEFKKSHQLSLSILKQFGFGSTLMESRINMEVEDLISLLKEQKGAPVDPRQPISKSIIGIILSIVFGNRMLSSKEDIAKRNAIYDLTYQIIHPPPELMALEFLNILRFVPKYANFMKSFKNVSDELFKIIEKKIDENLESGDEENFVSCYIRSEGDGLDREQLAYIIRDFLFGGTDTTATTSLWAVVLLANHPAVQQKLQADIDGVVPRDRLPSLDDKAKMSYIEAVIMEVMRCKTLVPLGLGHMTMCDTEVGGFFIPKGSMILPNLYAAHMRTDVWSDPQEFRPERFLDPSGNIMHKELVIPFSLGKRSCLGELLARQEIFLFITGLLQNFDILPPEGCQSVDASECVMLVNSPSSFQVRFLPRSD